MAHIDSLSILISLVFFRLHQGLRRVPTVESIKVEMINVARSALYCKSLFKKKKTLVTMMLHNYTTTRDLGTGYGERQRDGDRCWFMSAWDLSKNWAPGHSLLWQILQHIIGIMFCFFYPVLKSNECSVKIWYVHLSFMSACQYKHNSKSYDKSDSVKFQI